MKVVGVLLVIPLALASSCLRSSSRPVSVIEVCLPQKGDRTAFMLLMKREARASGMEMLDRSWATRRELRGIQERDRNASFVDEVFNTRIVGRDGTEASFGNWLAEEEMIISFSAGRNEADARAFAERLTAEISRRWKVEEVPSGEAAGRMSICV